MYGEPTPPGLFLNSEMIKTRLTLQTVTLLHLKKKKNSNQSSLLGDDKQQALAAQGWGVG